MQDCQIPVLLNLCHAEEARTNVFSAFTKPNKVSSKNTKLSKLFIASNGRLLLHVGGGQVQCPPKQAHIFHILVFTLQQFGISIIKINTFLIPQNLTGQSCRHYHRFQVNTLFCSFC